MRDGSIEAFVYSKIINISWYSETKMLSSYLIQTETCKVRQRYLKTNHARSFWKLKLWKQYSKLLCIEKQLYNLYSDMKNIKHKILKNKYYIVSEELYDLSTQCWQKKINQYIILWTNPEQWNNRFSPTINLHSHQKQNCYFTA